MSAEDRLTTAVWYAQQIAATVPPSGSSLDPIWDASSDVLAKLYEAGYAPEEFLSEGDAVQLNFALDGAETARRFFRSYALEVRKSLCNADDELRRNIQTATSAGIVTLLTTLASALTIPTGAVIVLAPIAAVLLTKGIDAFCSLEAVSPSADGAQGSAVAQE